MAIGAGAQQAAAQGSRFSFADISSVAHVSMNQKRTQQFWDCGVVAAAVFMCESAHSAVLEASICC
jgi:hypothetical protein